MDKPAGPTSHDVVVRVRRLLGTREVGHAGTLDPFATGLLVVLVGRATRLARFVEQQPKAYVATARLGATTTTDDLTGEITGGGFGERGAPARPEIEQVLARMTGPQAQRPPAFSAKRTGGERSYRRARRGEKVELAPVGITIHQAEVLAYSPPELRFRVLVSPGTYVRAIARDLGEGLGCGAHLVALRRESIGPLRVEDAVPLDQLQAGSLRPPLDAVRHLPSVMVGPAAEKAIGYGQRPELAAPPGTATGPVAAVSEGGRLLAVGRVADGRFMPQVVLEAAG